MLLLPLLLPLLLAVALGTGDTATVAAPPSSSVSLSVPVVAAMLLVLRRVGLRVLRLLLTLAVLLPDSSPKGLPWRLGLLPLLPAVAAAAAAACRAEGRTLNVAPPTRSLTTAMLFSVKVPVLSLQQRHSTASATHQQAQHAEHHQRLTL
jgi:hypothetical protein